jgi:undecaprenyl-diphosphatase
MTVFQSIIIAIVEGITEFLPVSSTGHMIITQKLLGIKNSEFVKLFIVNIQFGAILSVLVIYWKKFLDPVRQTSVQGSWWKKFTYRYDFYLKLLVAFLPAVIFGLLFIQYIYTMLESAVVVAVSLVLGGIILIFIDRWFKSPSDNQEITYPKAFKIGLFQVIAMIPGVSRSAASIIGGLTQKLTRKNAAEFSFFLAVPTMLGASVLEMYKTYHSLTAQDIRILILGNILAFIVALVAIKGFIAFLTRHGFKLFGYYRIAVGLVILILLALGIDMNIMG